MNVRLYRCWMSRWSEEERCLCSLNQPECLKGSKSLKLSGTFPFVWMMWLRMSFRWLLWMSLTALLGIMGILFWGGINSIWAIQSGCWGGLKGPKYKQIGASLKRAQKWEESLKILKKAADGRKRDAVLFTKRTADVCAAEADSRMSATGTKEAGGTVKVRWIKAATRVSAALHHVWNNKCTPFYSKTTTKTQLQSVWFSLKLELIHAQRLQHVAAWKK